MIDGGDDIRLIQGDCLDVLPTLDDNSVDSVVTDPPYGLRFLGRKWDYDVPSVAIWAQCLRVLKPGGHLLAFAGTRTQHRMAVRIEDAGFEIRDMIAWIYGSGFPKSLDVSKAIDSVRDRSKLDALNDEIRRARKVSGLSLADIGRAMQEATGGQYGNWYHRGGHMFFETGGNLPSRPEWDRLRHVLPIDEEFYAVYEAAEREMIRHRPRPETSGTMAAHGDTRPWIEKSRDVGYHEVAGKIPVTAAAHQWNGWGTALKPAMETITVARKSLVGTVADNVLAHGTGAINIDGCRVGMDGQDASDRWPANFIHDGSDEATGPLGSAARYFFCAKASRADRGPGNDWPTVKPTDLMRYLVRLVTPPGGITLDPFLGSGSTGKAAILEGFRFVGIELDDHAMTIARRRIDAARLPMFDRPEPAAPTPRAARPAFAFATEDGSA